VLAYILISLFLLVMFSCAEDTTYSPETDNANALRPMPEGFCDSPPIGSAFGDLEVRCDSSVVNFFVPQSQAPPWCGGSVQWVVGSEFRFTTLYGPWAQGNGFLRWRGAIARYGTGSTVTATVTLRFLVNNPVQCLDLCASGGISSPNITGCGTGGGGHGGGGGFDEQGKVSAHRFACPAFDGSGACVCDQGGLNPQDVMGSFWWAYGIF
jgi:hypothetical protein